jgi:hypothetical protein
MLLNTKSLPLQPLKALQPQQQTQSWHPQPVVLLQLSAAHLNVLKPTPLHAESVEG